MGEVFLAEDTSLKRRVALKFLPMQLTRDQQANRRFMLEAQAASSLDHPNICTIHGIEETSDGRMFIVMAHCRGETLKEKINRGPLSLEQALDIAGQVAAGLSRAHQQGIVHRDIKPANILVGDDGLVKILDFGLAKLIGQKTATRPEQALGTVAYMSPEQAMGRRAGEQTDIWSLGVVLYEMVAGCKPYTGEYDQALLYAIVNEQPPDIARIRGDVPPPLRTILTRCLNKEPAERYPRMADLLADLNDVKQQLKSRDASVSSAKKTTNREKWLRFGLVAAAALIAAFLLIWQLFTKGKMRSAPLEGESRQVTSGDVWNGDPALSPDGTRIAYASDASGNRDIYIIGVQGGNLIQLTNDAASDYYPDWFPDGTALAFVSTRNKTTAIWKIDQLGGGATLLLPDAIDPAISPDGKWIAFSMSFPGSNGYLRIGIAPLNDLSQARRLTGDADGLWNHRFPAWSPDGQSISYSSQDDLWIVTPSGSPARRLLGGSQADSEPAWSSDGRFIYFSSMREATLALWRIDAKGGIPERMTMGSGSEHAPSICRNGFRLAYATRTVHNSMLIRDLKSGQETKLPGLRNYCPATLAPDGSKVVYASDRGGKKIDLWIQSLEKGIPAGQPQRLTENPGNVSFPMFSPDGQWIAYYQILEGQRDIYTIAVSGGKSFQFTDDPAADFQPAWSPDGSHIAFVSERGGGSRIWIAPVKEGKLTGLPRCITNEKVLVLSPSWSPDGQHIAFVGCSENRCEVWIAQVDGSSPPRAITSGTDANLVRWDVATGTILISGTWGEDRFSLRRLSPHGGIPKELAPPVVFGSLAAALATFDVSRDGRLLIFSHEDVKGNIWMLEAKKRIF